MGENAYSCRLIEPMPPLFGDTSHHIIVSIDFPCMRFIDEGGRRVPSFGMKQVWRVHDWVDILNAIRTMESRTAMLQ